MNTMSRKLTALLAGLVLAMSFAGPAFGQSTLDAYSDEGGVIESQGENGAQSPAAGGGGGDDGGVAGDESSSLPFTGLDLALIAGSGLLLVGAGVGMRVLTRGPQTDPRSI
jgi:hypothetical protein